MNKKLNDKYVKLIKNIGKDSNDKEHDHVEADELLCGLLRELGYQEVVDGYNNIEKWYT